MLNSSPKIALGAHKMAAELQRRPYGSAPIVTNIKCHVIRNYVALVVDVNQLSIIASRVRS